MATGGKAPETVKSPLHRLQSAIVKDLPFGKLSDHEKYHRHSRPQPKRTESLQQFDTESLYSFDSVSTNGRLLDRLDLESEEYLDDEEYPRRRELFASIQSTGRLLDRLGLDDNLDELGGAQPYKFRPVLASSSLNLERMKSLSSTPVRTLSQSSRMPLKSAPYKVVLQKGNFSVDSLQGDIATLSHGSSVSVVSLFESGSSAGSTPHTPMRLNDNRSRLFPSENSISEVGPESPYEQNNSNLSLPTLYGNLQVSPDSPHKRNISASSNASNASLDSGLPIFNPSSRFDPSLEVSTKKAIQLRLSGNHREASYQLQISASPPYNYPRAMYLYAKALQLGQGVKLNESHAVKWLCRCTLVSAILENALVDERSLTNYVSKLNELSASEMTGLVKQNLTNEDLDPFKIHDEFQSYPASVLSKIASNNSKDANTVGGAYYQLGTCLIQGSGVPKDETTGRLFLAKSGSLGFGDAMVTLGELWSTKSKNFKKDLNTAAVWLRIGELFGKKDLGNSWIYKEKYTERGKKK